MTSFTEKFKHNQIVCAVDARTLLLSGEPNYWQKPVLLTAISAKGEKAFCSYIHTYGRSSSAWITFSHDFLTTLVTSKFLSLASRDLRALLLAGVLKICTELDNNMKLHRGMNCRAKGKLESRILGKVKLGVK